MAPEPFAVNVNTGTIANTGTFQTGASANAIRKGALVINNSTHTLEVAFAQAGSASAAASIPLAPGLTLNTGQLVPNGVYQGEIAINGTSEDAYCVLEFTRQ